MPKRKEQTLRSSSISTEWLYGLDEEERTAFEQAWRNSTYVLDKLKALIERKAEALAVDTEVDYNSPNWTVLRADKNGQLRAFKKILDLLP